MIELEELVAAAKAGDLDAVRTLIAGHPRLASLWLPSGESPLMAALYRGHRPVVDALIELGAARDVFAAAALGDIAALRHALRTPGAVNAFAYDGWTPLHLSAFFGQLEAARLLLDAGADPAALSRNSLQNTPLHAATAGKHEHVALLILDRGGDPEATDAGGFTPRRIAEENQLLEFLSSL